MMIPPGLRPVFRGW